jgi:glutaredoxin
VVVVIELDKDPNGKLLLDGIEQLVGRRSVPQVFIGGEYFGGLHALRDAQIDGRLDAIVEDARVTFNSKESDV